MTVGKRRRTGPTSAAAVADGRRGTILSCRRAPVSDFPARTAVLIMAIDASSWERRRLAGTYVIARFARVPARRRRSQGRLRRIRRIAPGQNENCCGPQRSLDRGAGRRKVPRARAVGGAFLRMRVMKVLKSLKSAKKRHRDCRIVRRKGRLYVINKTNPRFKARQS